MPETTCGATAARCVCIKDPDHLTAGDEVHACDPAECGGSWRGSEADDTLEPVTFPNPFGGGGLTVAEAEAMTAALSGGPITVPRGGIRFGGDRG